MDRNMLIIISDPDPMRVYKRLERIGYPEDWKLMVDRNRILIMVSYYTETIWIKKRFHSLFKTWVDEVPKENSNREQRTQEAHDIILRSIYPDSEIKVEWNV